MSNECSDTGKIMQVVSVEFCPLNAICRECGYRVSTSSSKE